MESTASRAMDRLLVQARQGSRSAVNQLMASCRPGLRERAKSLLSRRLLGKLDASDLVQEVQYHGMVRFDQFEGRSGGEFYAWLVGILKRRVLRAQRFWGEKRRDRNREEPLSPAWSARGEPAQTGTSVLQRLSQDEECERLKLAASWCRADDLAVISMHLFEGRSHDEIATELEVATATARQRYCRAVRRVGEAMQLLELMTRHGLTALQQDVIGVHRFQGANPRQIAQRLQLPEELVARWIAEARPLVGHISKDEP